MEREIPASNITADPLRLYSFAGIESIITQLLPLPALSAVTLREGFGTVH